MFYLCKDIWWLWEDTVFSKFSCVMCKVSLYLLYHCNRIMTLFPLLDLWSCCRCQAIKCHSGYSWDTSNNSCKRHQVAVPFLILKFIMVVVYSLSFFFSARPLKYSLSSVPTLQSEVQKLFLSIYTMKIISYMHFPVMWLLCMACRKISERLGKR
jgi:hypothetical protein